MAAEYTRMDSTEATLMLKQKKACIAHPLIYINYDTGYNSIVCFMECGHIASKSESFKMKTKLVFCNKALRVRGKWLFFQQQALPGNTYSAFCTHLSLIQRTEMTGLVYLLLIRVKYQRCSCCLLSQSKIDMTIGNIDFLFLFCLESFL